MKLMSQNPVYFSECQQLGNESSNLGGRRWRYIKRHGIGITSVPPSQDFDGKFCPLESSGFSEAFRSNHVVDTSSCRSMSASIKSRQGSPREWLASMFAHVVASGGSHKFWAGNNCLLPHGSRITCSLYPPKQGNGKTTNSNIFFQINLWMIPISFAIVY